MFELIFGLVWTAFTGFAMWAFTSPAGTSGRSGSGVAWIVLILFLGIGLFLIFRGLKRVLTDAMTSMKGSEISGVVVDIMETGSYANGRPELKAAIVAILPDRTTKMFYEIIGFNYRKYRMGECVKLKHYKNDVNIIGLKMDNNLSYDELEIVERIRSEHSCSGEYIDGVVRRTHRNPAMNSSFINNEYAGDGYSGDGYSDGGYSDGGYNDGYTTHSVKNVGVHKVDEDTVVIDGVEYKKNTVDF